MQNTVNSSFWMMELLVIVAAHFIMSYPIYVMGKKTNQDNAWFAFVPLLQTVLLLQIAGKDLWWILLCFVPCVNIIIGAIIWMGVAEAMDKPGWTGLLIFVPGINLLLPFYLAFA